MYGFDSVLVCVFAYIRTYLCMLTNGCAVCAYVYMYMHALVVQYF